MKSIIKINGLFGQYSSEFDLSSRCSILIGSNGVGKSTILKIIKNLLEYNFIELSRYEFDNIELETEESNYVTRYVDLFPRLDVFLNILKEYTDTSIFIESTSGEESVYSIMADALANVDKLSIKNAYQKYLSSCLFNKPINREIASIISNITSIFNIADDPTEIVKRTLNGISTQLNPSGFQFIGNEPIITCFKNSETAKEANLDIIYSTIKALQSNQIIYFDAVRSFHMNSEQSTRSTVYSKTLNWLDQYGKTLKDPDKRFIDDIDPIPKFGIPFVPHEIETEVVALVKKELSNPKYERRPTYDSLMKDYLLSFTENSTIEVNSLISYFYYDEGFIKEMNGKAIGYYQKYIGKSFADNQISDANYRVVSRFFYDNDIVNNIYNYIAPIILSNSLFSKTVFGIDLIRGYYRSSIISPIELAFYEFYQNEFDKFMTYSNPKIELLKKLIGKYLVDKEIIITAAGLRIFKVNKKTKRSGPFELIENSSNEIALDELSSGEKKIILILLFCVFFSDSTLLIDEPELSLSIVWQEALIPDIMENTDLERLIVATHSPFIASSEELIDSIVTLPTKEI